MGAIMRRRVDASCENVWVGVDYPPSFTRPARTCDSLEGLFFFWCCQGLAKGCELRAVSAAIFWVCEALIFRLAQAPFRGPTL
jgi:hypothetical protein